MSCFHALVSTVMVSKFVGSKNLTVTSCLDNKVFMSATLGGVTLSWSSSTQLLTAAWATKIFNHLFIQAFNQLYMDFVLLLSIMQVIQMLLMGWKLLQPFCWRCLEFIVSCKHLLVEFHAFFRCLLDYIYQSLSNFTTEIHDIILNLQPLWTLHKSIFRGFFIYLKTRLVDLV